MRQLRIIIRELRFRNPRGMRGRSDVSVNITMNGSVVGNPYDQWTVRSRDTVDFDEASYTLTIDVEGRTTPLELVVEPHYNEPGNTAVIGGPLRHQVPWPYQPRRLEAARREFAVEWEIAPLEPETPAETPAGIFACRENRSGAVLYNTAGAANQMLRVEVHEVLPAPKGRGEPRRPVFPRGTPAAWTDGGVGCTAPQLSAGTDLNIIANPAVIPIIPVGVARDASNCSLFRVTYYRPRTFNFTEDDPRLQWSIVSTGGGAARFFGRSTGRVVSVHGVTEGEIGLEVRFERTLVTVYRVLVRPYVSIPFRCTILYGHATQPGLRPRSTPADVQRHVMMCNRFLWQMGLKLTPFSSTALGWLPHQIPPANVHPVENTPGFFTANVPGWWTRGIGDNVPAAAVNCLPYVFNFAYIKSYESNDVLGMGCYTEVNSSASVSDEGTPSTSWKRPSGVNPDSASRAVRMHRLTWHSFFRDSRFAHAFAMYVTDRNPNDMMFAGTIAHELGHILGLNHRVEDPRLMRDHTDYDDGLWHPPRQNVMHWSELSRIAQDFDIVQARQVRLCPLLNAPAGQVGVAPSAAPAGSPAPTPTGGGHPARVSGSSPGSPDDETEE